MTDILPLFSLLAFFSTISKHFTNVTYVDLVGEKPHVVVKTANLTWNDEASNGGQKSVDQHPQVFWFFFGMLSCFLKAFVKKTTIPSEVSRFFPTHAFPRSFL